MTFSTNSMMSGVGVVSLVASQCQFQPTPIPVISDRFLLAYAQGISPGFVADACYDALPAEPKPDPTDGQALGHNVARFGKSDAGKVFPVKTATTPISLFLPPDDQAWKSQLTPEQLKLYALFSIEDCSWTQFRQARQQCRIALPADLDPKNYTLSQWFERFFAECENWMRTRYQGFPDRMSNGDRDACLEEYFRIHYIVHEFRQIQKVGTTRAADGLTAAQARYPNLQSFAEAYGYFPCYFWHNPSSLNHFQLQRILILFRTHHRDLYERIATFMNLRQDPIGRTFSEAQLDLLYQAFQIMASEYRDYYDNENPRVLTLPSARPK